MNKNIHTMTKYILTTLLSIASMTYVHAQAPYINSISPSSAGVGEVINITGSNFTGVNKIYFGGVLADNATISVSPNYITVAVPFGATFDQIVVLHPTNGAGYSSQKFNPTYGGQSTTAANVALAMASESGQHLFSTGQNQSQDLCACDFDNDGDLDVIVSNVEGNSITVFTNTTSAVGTVSFSSSSIINSSPVTNVTCGDIDGDGKPDFTANALSDDASIYIYHNTSTVANTITFDPIKTYKLPRTPSNDIRKPGRMVIHDLDLDGKPEISVVTQGENIIYYFKNSSTVGTIDLEDPEPLTATENAGAVGLGGFDVADLNNDGMPELVVSNFSGNGYYIFKNSSSPGVLLFDQPDYYPTIKNINNLKTGDLNNDGFLDIVLTNGDLPSENYIEIAQNTTSNSGGTISFNTTFKVTGITSNWGLDFGDIDGDGKLDLAIASYGVQGYFAVMNKNNGVDTLSPSDFDVAKISDTNDTKNILIADADHDGKPDFLYISKSKSGLVGNLGVMLNQNCFTPVISPSGTIKLCDAESIDLIAPGSGYTYLWEKDNVPQPSTTNTLSTSTAGVYTVTIEDGCSTTSAAVTVEVVGESYTSPSFTFTDATPCSGDDITLNVNAGAGTASYLWSGPNGFTSTDENPILTGVTAQHSGNYTVTTTSNTFGCQKTSAEVTLTVTTTPVVSVINPLPDSFCSGSTLDLSTNEFSGYTYDWKLDGASFTPTAQTDPSLLEASAAGDYSVTVTGSGCSYTSEARTLSEVAPPVSSFTVSDADLTFCENTAAIFTASSTGAFDIENTWDFGDGSTPETSNSLSHTFSSNGSYDVSVTAKYIGIANCTYTAATQEMTIVAPPSGAALDLIQSTNSDPLTYDKCPENEVTLLLADSYMSYDWVVNGTDTVSTTAVAKVSTEAEVYVELVNDDNCAFRSSSIDVINYAGGGIEISTTNPNSIEDDIDLGKIINLEDNQTTVSLSVSNTANPAWEPAAYIDDTTAVDVTVSRTSGKQLIKVYGTDVLGCNVQDSVTLITPGVRADRSFTPNGDGIGDCWQISNVGSTDCEVVIFDSKGRRIRDIAFNGDTTDDCVWDGTKSGGSPLPDGVYYYFIKCSDGDNEGSGSIFMAR
ncbi:FG-GAP-like repeat-containing protein [Reichenbachiella carrageenanivorans]|uniref:FG-GAP-like repeat-containing protein n=1 Tax=Reichenbachiella carrageenanivorans TaxID=2979869 RepID=A0ABY6CYH6_9BACT|nr:FG-GAP-like repeat-containing protein [Reichenbachiella carrageenanivorans]UXX78923.1 FG-GAP-like repeat-containing protein [Reichenbachiella carrageenanivorans]